jgi:hypothetical protein
LQGICRKYKAGVEKRKIIVAGQFGETGQSAKDLIVVYGVLLSSGLAVNSAVTK